MRKIFPVILALYAQSFALNDVAVPNTFSDSGIIYASEHNANFDTLEARVNQLNDSLDAAFMRFTDLSSHDSTLKYIKVDTIRSNPNVDSLAGNIIFGGQATWTKKVSLDSIRSNPNVDSLQGMDVIRGNPNIDSISGSPYISARLTTPYIATDSIRSNPNVDSLGGNIVFGGQGTWTKKVSLDSIRSNPDVDSISGSPVISTIVKITDSLYVPKLQVATSVNMGTVTLSVDSLKSNKGISATTMNTGNGNYELYAMDQNVRTTDAPTFATINTGLGNYEIGQNLQTSDDVTFDSLRLTDAISVANQATFGSYVSADSLASAKGITGTTINTGNGNYEVYAMNQNVRTTDNVVFDSVKVNKVRCDSFVETNRLKFRNLALTTIVDNIVQANYGSLQVQNEGGAATDTIDSIWGRIGSQELLLISQYESGKTTVIKGGKNIAAPTAGVSLTGHHDFATLFHDGVHFVIISFQNND
jgi:hypothetical protein